jgi:hypothetical protein
MISRRTGSALLAALMLGAAPAALAAQTPAVPAAPAAAPTSAAAPEEEGEAEEIVVTGVAPRGSVPGPIRPEQELTAADVRSYGVSSVSELLTELAPQTNAAGGAPVVLLNGKRVSSFAEIQDIPARRSRASRSCRRRCRSAMASSPTRRSSTSSRASASDR